MLKEKYRDVIGSISKATGFDMGVAELKLRYMVRNHGNPKADVYAGIPENFDWEEAKEILKQEDEEKEKRG